MDCLGVLPICEKLEESQPSDHETEASRRHNWEAFSPSSAAKHRQSRHEFCDLVPNLRRHNFSLLLKLRLDRNMDGVGLLLHV